MNFKTVEEILSTNMFESIKNKDFSKNMCFVMALIVWREVRNELFSKITSICIFLDKMSLAVIWT